MWHGGPDGRRRIGEQDLSFGEHPQSRRRRTSGQQRVPSRRQSTRMGASGRERGHGSGAEQFTVTCWPIRAVPRLAGERGCKRSPRSRGAHALVGGDQWVREVNSRVTRGLENTRQGSVGGGLWVGERGSKRGCRVKTGWWPFA